METSLNRRDQLLIILLVLVLHALFFGLLVLVTCNQSQHTPSAPVIIELQEEDQTQWQEEKPIELSEHGGFSTMPTIAQNESAIHENVKEEGQQNEGSSSVRPERAQQVEGENQLDAVEENKEEINHEEVIEQTIAETEIPDIPDVQSDIEHKPVKSETTIETKKPLENIQKKPQPIQKPQLTLASLAQGFIHQLKQDNTHVFSTEGKNQGPPSTEQLMYERYLQKIFQCIVTSYRIHKHKIQSIEQSQEGVIGLIWNRNGSLQQLYVIESSGNRSIDAFALLIFKEASSSFPPAPQQLPNNQYAFRVHFLDIRQFGTLYGWNLR